MKRIYSLFLALCSTILLQAQNNVGIGTNSIDPSAKLEVNASDKGLLIPRVALTSTTDAVTIPTPATSLLVYNTNTAGTAPTNVIPGYYYWDGTKWVRMANTIKAQNGANISTTAPNASATDPYVELGGPLVRPTTVSALTATNKMSFTGTGVDMFNVDGTTLSVDGTNHRVGVYNNAPREALDVTGTIYGSVNGIFGGSYISGTNYENQFFSPTGADNTFHSEQFSTVTTAMTGISMFQNGGSSLEQDLWTQGIDISPVLSSTNAWYGSNDAGTQAQLTSKGWKNTGSSNDGQVMGNGQDNTTHYALCPDNYVASGFEVWCGAYYDGSMKLRCTQLAAGWQTTAYSPTPDDVKGFSSINTFPGGNPSKVTYGSICPTGTFVKAVSIHTSTTFDNAVKVYCTGIKRVP